MDELKYELWLTKLDITNTRKNRLVDCLGNAKEVYDADKEKLLATNMVKEEVADIIVKSKVNVDLDGEYNSFLSHNQTLLTRPMEGFPDKLKIIKDAPYGLFYIGNLPKDFDKCVSIVGARRCSEYGRRMAIEIAEELSKRGYIIVSGMALGIDNSAHVGALKADGISVAVLGCGVDICYPRNNINTYMEIQKKGAVISDYYPGTQPVNTNFPPRNRIISALANQVIIIEAREKSGSLITADYALDQGKDIYALPGRITDSLSGGCNKLIEQGAGIITSIPDLINNIEEVSINTLYTGEDSMELKDFREKEDAVVYGFLDFYPKSIETIINETNFDLMRVLSSIMNLCELGYAKETFVNEYVKIK